MLNNWTFEIFSKLCFKNQLSKIWQAVWTQSTGQVVACKPGVGANQVWISPGYEASVLKTGIYFLADDD